MPLKPSNFGRLHPVLSVHVSTILRMVKAAVHFLSVMCHFFHRILYCGLCGVRNQTLLSSFCLPVEGQQICVAAFTIIKIWLQQITLPCKEIFQPICSFIAMTVANNSKWMRQCLLFYHCVMFRGKKPKLMQKILSINLVHVTRLFHFYSLCSGKFLSLREFGSSQPGTGPSSFCSR